MEIQPTMNNWRPGLKVDFDKIACIQWHLTSRCIGDCKFCYMKDSPNYQNELKNELSTEQCINIAKDFSSYLRENDFIGLVLLTGGDPLLREDFWDITHALRKENTKISILGNPHLIWDETAKRLLDSGVLHYQLSIDGMERTHDYFRGQGSFTKTWRAVDILKKNGLSVGISYTLSKKNFKEVEDVIELCRNHGVNSFRPTRLVPEGRGEQFKNDLLGPVQYKETLEKILIKILAIFKKERIFIDFPSCDGLRFITMTGEIGNYISPNLSFKMSIQKGCSSRLLTILPDGNLQVCRRLQIGTGNILSLKMKEAFDTPLALKIRNLNSYTECKNCKLAENCFGGCPSLTYAMTGDPFKKDPQCFIDN